jgi:PGF-CTERM protein
MKLWKSSICVASIAVIILSCSTASATTINDGTGDIWHWTQSGTTWAWVGNVGNKPNIDITEVSYVVSGDKITIALKVSGSIQNSENVVYVVYYNSTDSHYVLNYMNGNGGGAGYRGETMTLGNFSMTQNVTISGGTLSVVLDVVGDTSKVDLWGSAMEYTTSGDTMAEWWGDWAPNEKFTQAPDDGSDDTDGTQDGDNSTGEKGTPGFEVVLVIAAVSIALLFLRRRR